MRKFAFGILTISLAMMSCSKDTVEAENVKKSETSLEGEYVSIFDTRIRDLNNGENYVKEVYIADFSDEGVMSDRVFLNGDFLVDDGSGMDLEAGDQIYTNEEAGTYDAEHPYNPDYSIFSVQSNPIVNDAFTSDAQLQELTDNYVMAARPGGSASITCDVEFGVGGCLADDWGWCNDCCIGISNCSVTVGVSW